MTTPDPWTCPACGIVGTHECRKAPPANPSTPQAPPKRLGGESVGGAFAPSAMPEWMPDAHALRNAHADKCYAFKAGPADYEPFERVRSLVASAHAAHESSRSSLPHAFVEHVANELHRSSRNGEFKLVGSPAFHEAVRLALASALTTLPSSPASEAPSLGFDAGYAKAIGDAARAIETRMERTRTLRADAAAEGESGEEDRMDDWLSAETGCIEAIRALSPTPSAPPKSDETKDRTIEDRLTYLEGRHIDELAEVRRLLVELEARLGARIGDLEREEPPKRDEERVRWIAYDVIAQNGLIGDVNKLRKDLDELAKQAEPRWWSTATKLLAAHARRLEALEAPRAPSDDRASPPQPSERETYDPDSAVDNCSRCLKPRTWRTACTTSKGASVCSECYELDPAWTSTPPTAQENKAETGPHQGEASCWPTSQDEDPGTRPTAIACGSVGVAGARDRRETELELKAASDRKRRDETGDEGGSVSAPLVGEAGEGKCPEPLCECGHPSKDHTWGQGICNVHASRAWKPGDKMCPCGKYRPRSAVEAAEGATKGDVPSYEVVASEIAGYWHLQRRDSDWCVVFKDDEVTPAVLCRELNRLSTRHPAERDAEVVEAARAFRDEIHYGIDLSDEHTLAHALDGEDVTVTRSAATWRDFKAAAEKLDAALSRTATETKDEETRNAR